MIRQDGDPIGSSWKWDDWCDGGHRYNANLWPTINETLAATKAGRHAAFLSILRGDARVSGA